MRRLLSLIPLIACLVILSPWSPLRGVRAQSERGISTLVLAANLPVNPALAPPVPIPQGSCVSQAPAGTHGITVCWTASISTTVTGYNVYVGTATGGPYTRQNTAIVTGTSFFYSTPNLGGVKQFIVIRSYDGTAESANSAEVSVTAIGNPLPPTGPQAVAVSLRWRGAAIVHRETVLQ